MCVIEVCVCECERESMLSLEFLGEESNSPDTSTHVSDDVTSPVSLEEADGSSSSGSTFTGQVGVCFLFKCVYIDVLLIIHDTHDLIGISPGQAEVQRPGSSTDQTDVMDRSGSSQAGDDEDGVADAASAPKATNTWPMSMFKYF